MDTPLPTLIVAVVMAATACSPTDEAAQPAESIPSIVTTATTTAATESQTTSGPVLTPTSTAVPAATTIPALELAPNRTIEIPADWYVESVAGTDPLVVLANRPDADRDRGYSILWRVGTDIASATEVRDLLPQFQFGRVQKLVNFEGRFYAFITGRWDETGTGESTGPASMLVSDDGTDWTLTTIDSGPLDTVERIAYTPDSPPSGDTSAVMDATVYGDTLYATGWDVVDGQLAIMLWATSDGEQWSARHIPNGAFDSEYGNRLAVGEAGVVVSLGGPRHMGVGSLVSTSPGEFRSIEGELGLDEAFVADAAAGAFGFAVIQYGFNFSAESFALSTSASGDEWTRTLLPTIESDQNSPNYRLVQDTTDPTVYHERYDEQDSTVLAWRLTEGVWTQLGVAGNRVVAADGRLVTTGAGLLRTYLL